MRRVFFVITLALGACYETDYPKPNTGGRARCDPPDRIGCVCKDGTRYTNTIDRAACDANGGLDYYLCKW